MDKLEKTINAINKRFGAGSIFNLGSDDKLDIQRVSSGSISLDVALGGGIPVGRIITISGQPSGGKTTVSCHILSEFQKAFPDKYVAIADIENAIDRNYTANIGVDLEKCLISQVETAQDAWSIIETLIISGEVSAIFLDSIAALVTRQELEGEVGDSHVGLSARINNQAMRKLVGLVKKHNVTLILANQLREDIGSFSYGPVEPGGKGINFAASIKLNIARIKTEKDGGEAVGNKTRIKVKKNKVAPPFKECEFDIIYGEGIDKAGEIRDLGVMLRIIDKAGAWYKVIDKDTGEILLKGQGKIAFRDELKNHPEILTRLENEIQTHYFSS